jgi:hypothetical protein
VGLHAQNPRGLADQRLASVPVDAGHPGAGGARRGSTRICDYNTRPPTGRASPPSRGAARPNCPSLAIFGRRPYIKWFGRRRRPASGRRAGC